MNLFMLLRRKEERGSSDFYPFTYYKYEEKSFGIYGRWSCENIKFMRVNEVFCRHLSKGKLEK